MSPVSAAARGARLPASRLPRRPPRRPRLRIPKPAPAYRSGPETCLQAGVVHCPHDLARAEFAWHVGVRPSRYPARMYYLYDELAAVADEIADKEGINVFFVVGEPTETHAVVV